MHHFRVLSNCKTDEFKLFLSNKLNGCDWNLECADDLMQNFIECFNCTIETFCSIKCVPSSKTKNRRKPWINSELLCLIKEKNKLYNKYVKNPITFGQQYKSLRNRISNLLKSSKNFHYKNELNRHRNDNKQKWNIINEIMNRKCEQKPIKLLVNDCIINNDSEIASCFNSNFSNVCNDIVDGLEAPIINFETYLTGAFTNSFYLRQILPTDVWEILFQLNNASGGHIGIPTWVLKECAHIIISPLCKIYNQCISSGVFPEISKIAKIVPIYKSDDPLNENNYRPISILSPLSKILEKFIYKELFFYFEDNNILCRQQAGFRPGFSTEHAIYNLLKRVISDVDSGKHGVCLFLDFRKAFDLVDQRILLKKLRFYGVRGIPLKLLESFFESRHQYVKIGKASSSTNPVHVGVAQGSTLGPLMFLIFINDIVNCSNILQFNLFADDTSLYFGSDNPLAVFDTFNRELKFIHDWINANKLCLNTNKSAFMLFSRSKNQIDFPDILINNEKIKKVDEYKFLGVLLDNKLSWKPHVLKLINIISRNTGIFYRIRSCLNLSASLTYYYSFIHPYLRYGLIFWNSVNANLFNKLIKLQKKIVRLITNSGRYEQSEPLFKKCKVLKLFDLFRIETCKFIHHDIIYNSHSDFVTHSEIHSYPTRYRSNLVRPFNRLNVGSKFINSAGVILYNSLSSDIRSAPISDFKFLMKYSYLNEYVN